MRPAFRRSSATTPCAWFPRLESFLRSSTTWRACASVPSKERSTWSRCSSCPTRRDIDGLRICSRSYGIRLGNGSGRRRLLDRQGSFPSRLTFQIWLVRRLCSVTPFFVRIVDESCERLRLVLYASRHVQVLISHRTGSSGREEQGHAIRGDERLRVVLRTVHPGTEIHWRRPSGSTIGPGPDPPLGRPNFSQPVRKKEPHH